VIAMGMIQKNKSTKPAEATAVVEDVVETEETTVQTDEPEVAEVPEEEVAEDSLPEVEQVDEETTQEVSETPADEQTTETLQEEEVVEEESDQDVEDGSTTETEVELDNTPESSGKEESQVVEVQEEEVVQTAPEELTLREELAGKLPKEWLETWGDDALRRFKETGEKQRKTLRGNWPSDARRHPSPTKWRINELKDAIDGFIKIKDTETEELVWQELYARYRLPGVWSREEAWMCIEHGVYPKKTPSGLWVNDTQREAKSLADFQYVELRAAILGEIETKFSREELVNAIRDKLCLKSSYDENYLIKKIFPEDNLSMNDRDVMLKSKLEEYKSVMAPASGEVSDEIAGAAQTMLWDQISKVMARPYPEFREGWNIILDFVNENYNILFKPELAYRGWRNLGFSGVKVTTFEEILALIINTRSTKNRMVQAGIFKPETVIRRITNENIRQNILAFYQPQ